MQESAEKFERQTGNLNEKYSSGCKALTESTKIALTETLNLSLIHILQQENQLLSMQQQRYESLKAAIEEARQARHDLRHQLCQLAALAEEGNLEKIKAYLSSAVSRIPSLELHFCENRAADGVVGYYCALAKREQIPFSVQDVYKRQVQRTMRRTPGSPLCQRPPAYHPPARLSLMRPFRASVFQRPGKTRLASCLLYTSRCV